MSDQPDYENGQPAPIPNDRKSIHSMVIYDITFLKVNGHGVERNRRLLRTRLADRKQYGQTKYGTILQAFNGRNCLEDAMEELIDLVVYLKQKIEEGKEQETLTTLGQDLLQQIYDIQLKTLLTMELVIGQQR